MMSGKKFLEMSQEELLEIIEKAQQSGQTGLRLEAIQELPPEIGQLINLKSLEIGYNKLTALPESIGQLTNLTSLHLRNNQLTMLPESIGQLINLTSLDLRNNQLTTLPEPIGQLTNLTSLEISYNKLTALPESIGQLTNLTSLDLRNNQLTMLPESIGQLINLTSLDLRNNQLTMLPESIGQLINLTSLDLRNNQLTMLPESIGQLTNLTSLEISYNKLTILPKSIGQLTNLTSLKINHNKLTVLPESIGRLTNLTSLDLCNNQLTTLPASIGQLTSLMTLDLRDSGLTSLPDVIGQLTNPTTCHIRFEQFMKSSDAIVQLPNFTSLDLSNNQLTTLPEWLGQLTDLIYLDLSNNQLTTLPEWLGQLTDLIYLDLSNNQLMTLPEWLGQLTNLTSLNLSNSQLTALPEWLAQLTNLVALDLSNNRLTSLPEWLVQLTNLKIFYLRSNQFMTSPDVIGQLSNLTALVLSDNQLKTSPELIGQLTNLTILDLSNNQLKTLPELIGQLTNLKIFELNGNSFSEIPPEVVRKGGLAVRDYYRQRLEANTDYIYEAKLLIIGEGGAGKTSLANKLKDPNYTLKLESSATPEKSTEGIDVLRLDFDHLSGNPFRINVWDFGGQEIYHATHQFFLTKRSLYLLVADTRQDNTDFNYWLEVVELLSEASPTLIVKNEKQERPCQVNENQLRGRFPNLEKILPTNLNTNRGLLEILAAVQHHISQLPHIGTPLPKTWVNVRKVLETDSRNYISQDEFLTLCDTHGFKRHEDKLQLSGYLHDLGVCLHFQDDAVLEEIVILKPEWGTTAVYKVLDTAKVQENLGCFTDNDLAIIWADSQYATVRRKLLQLMMKFKLCYEIPHRPKTYIAPQLLSPNQPEYDWDDTNNLILRYHYEFMPKGMLTRFIVEMHRLIDSELVWKEGVILKDENARAEVIEAYYKNEIRIRITGKLKKPLLESIRHEFRKIHESYNKPEDSPEKHRLRYQEFIPCNCSYCKGTQTPFSYSLDRLQARLKSDRRQIECDISYEMIDVRSLIDDAIGHSANSLNREKDSERSRINIHIGDKIGHDKVGQDKIQGDKPEHL
ncbi:COR domain-containing protein [Altericista sp. CCNU0014]|uniref:leucine-rich repeat domain-containing protein n=1 Tax=Altericista sp. CCNU0014 TaxID=3082949 RepID=UPI00384B9B63